LDFYHFRFFGIIILTSIWNSYCNWLVFDLFTQHFCIASTDVDYTSKEVAIGQGQVKLEIGPIDQKNWGNCQCSQ